MSTDVAASNLLLGADNDAYDPNRAVLYQDMTQPLEHYFIASSHNTCVVLRSRLSSASSALASR